jgi:hypothetical protein
MSKLKWRSMIAVLSDLTEDELKTALDAELKTHKRPAIARRLHQRYSALRTARERDELLKGLKK